MTSVLRFEFGVRLVGLGRRWRQLLDRHLAVEGLTDATWAQLALLNGAGGRLHQKDLAQRAGLDASSLVRLLDILEHQGLVRRVPDPKDRRARRIQLTEPGEARVAEIYRVLKPIETALLQDLDEAALAQLSACFSRIEARIGSSDLAQV